MDLSRRTFLSATATAVAGVAAALVTSAAQARTDHRSARTPGARPATTSASARNAVPTDVVTAGSFSNLASASSRSTVRRELLTAGVPADRVDVTMWRAEQLLGAVGTNGLATGFRPPAEQPARYAPYAMQDAWTANHPGFPGHNCCLTVYTLAGHVITVAGAASPKAPLYDDLFLDREPISADRAAVPSARDRVRFDCVWAAGLTRRTQDVATQLATLQ